MTTLKAEKRTMNTKAKRLRREGYVTGNIFGREMKESMPIKIVQADAERLLKTNNKGSQVMVEVDGQSMNVLIKEIDYDSMKRQILEIDFQALVSNEKVHSVAEIILLNHEKVTTGVLQQLLEEVSYKAYPAYLVDKIQLDVGDMRVGDSIKVGDLPISSNETISLQTDLDAVVVTVTASKNDITEDEAEEGTDEK